MLRKIGWNFFGQQFSFVLSLVDRFLIVGLLLRAWGPQQYSDWVILVSSAGIAASCEFGLNIYYGNRWQAISATGSRQDFNRVLSIALGLALCLGCALALIAIAACLFADLKSWMGISALSQFEVSATFIVLSIAAISRVMRGSISQIYRGHGIFLVGTFVDFAAIGAPMVIAIIGALNGFRPLTIATGYLACDLIFGWLFMLSDQRRRFPGLVYKAAMPTRGELRDIARQSRWLAIVQGAPVLWLQVPVLVLGYLGFGAQIVGLVLVRTLVNFARQLGTMLALSTSVELVDALHAGRREDVRRTLFLIGSLLSAMTAALAVAVMAFGPGLIGLLSRHMVPFETGVAAFLLASAIIATPAVPIASLMTYSQKPAAAAMAQALLLTISLVMSAALALPFGLTGAAAGLALGEALALGIYLPAKGAKEFGFGIGAYLRHCAIAAIISLAWNTLAAIFVRSIVTADTNWGLVIGGGLWGCVGFIPSLLTALPSTQRKQILSTAQALVRTGLRSVRSG